MWYFLWILATAGAVGEVRVMISSLPGHALAQALPLPASAVVAPYLVVFLVAFVVAWVFTPIMRQVAIYFGIVDEPDGVRKLHRRPIAYLGGVAIFAGWLAALICSQFIPLHRVPFALEPNLTVNLSIILAASIIAFLGLWDDVLGLRPRTKIVGQLTAAIVLLSDGIGSQATGPLLGMAATWLHQLVGWPDAAVPKWFIVGTSSLFVIAVVVGCCNATNLTDGLDGLCGGVNAIMFLGFLALSIHLAMWGKWSTANLDGLRIVLALAVLGAVLGFLPYNFNPASIFMGDTGSMLLGFNCAMMILLMSHRPAPQWTLAALIIFALPALDTALAFTRRWLKRRPFFSPDCLHFHHQLLRRGFSVRQAVLIAYAVALYFVAVGSAVIYLRTRHALGLWAAGFATAALVAYRSGMIHERTPSAPADPSRVPLSPTRGLPAAAGEAGALELSEEAARLMPAGLGMQADWLEVEPELAIRPQPPKPTVSHS